MSEVSPNFKNALNFFNSLERGAGSPLIPRKTSSNFEVSLKLIVDSRTVENITNYDVKTIIPRARLTSKRAVLCGEKNFEPHANPQLPAKKHRDAEPEARGKLAGPFENGKKVGTASGNKVKHKIKLVTEETSRRTESKVQVDQPLTPDVEAKQIIEAFEKEITPYNTFEIPVNALDSDFFKQTLDLVPDVTVSFSKNKPKRNNSVYRLPKKEQQNER